MDPVAIASAVLAVPPALQAIRDLIEKKAPHLAAEVAQPLLEAEQHLLKFTNIGSLFLEAKSYHERLSVLALAMGELLDATSAPTNTGGFDPDAFDKQAIFAGWRFIRNRPELLPSLLHFLQNAKSLSDEPLILSNDGTPISGRPDFVRFAAIKIDIDILVRDYDSKSIKTKQEICEKVDQLRDHVTHQMLNADTTIIRNALAVASALSELRRRIEK